MTVLDQPTGVSVSPANRPKRKRKEKDKLRSFHSTLLQPKADLSPKLP